VAKTIRIVLSDDHEVFLEGLRMVLEGAVDLTVEGTAHDGDSALRLVAEHAPDVLLLDLHMPGTEPAAVIARSKAVAPATKILVLSADTRHEAVMSAVAAGAGYASDQVSLAAAGAMLGVAFVLGTAAGGRLWRDAAAMADSQQSTESR
jgi:DNA-binding NarL/FixJ family response regulator